MTTAAGPARRRWRRRSSCRTGGSMRTQARVFRLLPADPGPDLSTAAAAALADWPAAEARAALGRLARAHLVEAGQRAAAGGGCMTCCACTPARCATLSDRRARPGHGTGCSTGTTVTRTRPMIICGRCPANQCPTGFTGRDDALAWLDAERPNLVAAVAMAAATGRDQDRRRPAARPWSSTWHGGGGSTTGLPSWISRDTARRLGDRRNEAIALNDLGLALREVRPVRGGDHRAPGRGGDLPGDRRPARRGRGAGQPRRRAVGARPVRGGDHRAPGRGGDLPGNGRPARRGHGAEQPRPGAAGACAGSRRRSPRTRTRPRSTGRPATGDRNGNRRGDSARGRSPKLHSCSFTSPSTTPSPSM